MPSRLDLGVNGRPSRAASITSSEIRATASAWESSSPRALRRRASSAASEDLEAVLFAGKQSHGLTILRCEGAGRHLLGDAVGAAAAGQEQHVGAGR